MRVKRGRREEEHEAAATSARSFSPTAPARIAVSQPIDSRIRHSVRQFALEPPRLSSSEPNSECWLEEEDGHRLSTICRIRWRLARCRRKATGLRHFRREPRDAGEDQQVVLQFVRRCRGRIIGVTMNDPSCRNSIWLEAPLAADT
jgi:hypothetical protein